VVAFHAQQAVEKVFKAVMLENEMQVPRIHNLMRLYALISPFLNFTINESDLDALDSVYIASRYPVELGLITSGKPTLKESEALYQIANHIFLSISEFLEKN
jgi:HEPN domain-containing protein